jgi:hypothetical protein
MSDTDRGTDLLKDTYSRRNGLKYPVRDQYDQQNVVGKENKKKDAMRALKARPRVERVTPRNHFPNRSIDCGCGPTAIEPMLGFIHPCIRWHKFAR